MRYQASGGLGSPVPDNVLTGDELHGVHNQITSVHRVFRVHMVLRAYRVHTVARALTAFKVDKGIQGVEFHNSTACSGFARKTDEKRGMMNKFRDLYEHLDAALENNFKLFEAHDQQESYLSPLFNFVREAMDYPEMTQLDADSAAQAIDDWLVERRHCPPEDAWQAAFSNLSDGDDTDAFDARAMFLQVWDEIRTLPGETWLTSAWRRVTQRNTVQEICELEICRCLTRYAAFIALATELQQMRGEKPIFLPCREVGEIIGVNKETVVAYRRLAQKHGLLHIEKEHRYKEKNGEATEFRFDFARLAELE